MFRVRRRLSEEQLFGRVDLSSLIPGNVPDEVLQNDPAYAQLKAALERALSDFAANPDKAESKSALLEATEKADAYRKAVAALRPSEPTVRTTGKIPEADICFLDEIFKCNDGVLNSLLTALNERKYTNEGKTHSIPVISFFAASNEIPNFNDPQEKILQALYDRLELKVLTTDIADRAKRLAVLRDKQAGVSGQIAASFTLDELRAMQKEVEAIPVPESVWRICPGRRTGQSGAPFFSSLDGASAGYCRPAPSELYHVSASCVADERNPLGDILHQQYEENKRRI